MFSISPEDMLASCKALDPGAYINDLSYAMENWLEQEWIKISSFLKPVGERILSNFNICTLIILYAIHYCYHLFLHTEKEYLS